MYTPDSEDEQRRAFALDQAVRLVSVKNYAEPANAAKTIAKAFDKFLKDGDA